MYMKTKKLPHRGEDRGASEATEVFCLCPLVITSVVTSVNKFNGFNQASETSALIAFAGHDPVIRSVRLSVSTVDERSTWNEHPDLKRS